MCWIKLVSVFLLSGLSHLANGDTIVLTETGPIRGKPVEFGKVEAFLGIPYAEPPVGSFRFAKPVPKTSWNVVYDAIDLPPPCVQSGFGQAIFAPNARNMTEDCLYLNVWKPNSKEDDELKAVMFFIHGGGFVMGTSSMDVYNGAKLAEHGDVVVVTINYRLGFLGFFAGFTEDAPGNQGLYDQVLALRWIKDNAKHFHGDPDKITLFGESAGAFSVSMHQISPLSKNLFRRAILQSGSAINPQYTVENKVVTAINQLYTSEIGCASDDITLEKNAKDFINCIRNLPTANFMELEMKVFKKGVLLLSPRAGDDFLPQNAIEMFRKGLFKDSEVLMGVNRDEGSMLVTLQKPDVFGFFGDKVVDDDIFNTTTAYYAIKMLTQLNTVHPAQSNKIICSYLYDANKESVYPYLKAVSAAVGDYIINCGNVFQAEYHSMRGNPVYFYMFDHRTAAAPYGEWMGVPHFDEVQYVFGNPMFKYFTEEEKKLSRDIMNMWARFARTGNPNIPGGVEWPRYSYEDPKYYVIGKRDHVATRPDNNRCERWRNLFRSQIDDYVIQSVI